jgi:hypothetical protein
MTSGPLTEETKMTASTDHQLLGAWDAHLTFVKGPRKGEREPVLLTFLADGLIIHADEIRLETGQVPRGIGEWAAENDRLSYWFNVVLTHPDGRPANVVRIRAHGRLAPDGHTFTATGTGEVYGSCEDPLVTHHVDVRARRADKA